MLADTDLFQSALTRSLDRWDIAVTPDQRDLMRTHFEAVVETNRTMNLTRITEPIAAAVKHYVDSLALLLWARDRGIDVKTVLDVGTGAGYPAIPLAVMRPEWAVTAIDGTGKKVRFLAGVAEEMQLANLRLEHAHSLHWPTRRRFQVVLVRGIGALAKCMDQAAALVVSGGWLVVYKTAKVAHAELQTASEYARRLRLRPQEPFPYELDLAGEILRRALHIYRKHR